ncbi:unnamed protein product [Acidithrix sp. C25]|nr:unnamed protein product [Acidithrix sp. C25]
MIDSLLPVSFSVKRRLAHGNYRRIPYALLDALFNKDETFPSILRVQLANLVFVILLIFNLFSASR